MLQLINLVFYFVDVYVEGNSAANFYGGSNGMSLMDLYLLMVNAMIIKSTPRILYLLIGGTVKDTTLIHII